MNSYILYPKLSDVKYDIDKTQTINYYCDENGCGLFTVINNLDRNNNINIIDKQIIRELIIDIKRNQDKYMPQKLSGFLFHKKGVPILFLNNQTDYNTTENIALIDYTKDFIGLNLFFYYMGYI